MKQQESTNLGTVGTIQNNNGSILNEVSMENANATAAGVTDKDINPFLTVNSPINFDWPQVGGKDHQ